MPVSIMKISETKEDVTFHGVDKYMLFQHEFHRMLYKLCYKYRLTLNEALSMFHSNSKNQLVRHCLKPLDEDEREGRHF